MNSFILIWSIDISMVILSLHHIYLAVLAPMIYVFIIFCTILYYWIWLVVRRLFIRVKSIIEIEIGNYSKIGYYIGY